MGSKNVPKMVFDLKGSIYKRYTDIGDKGKFWKGDLNFSKTLKDQNIMQINKDIDYLFIQLPLERRK